MGCARRSLLLGATALVLLGCGAGQSTERLYAGRLVVGPYVAPAAYSAYAEARYLEAHGDRDGAIRAYRRAQASDPDSPDIRTRLGSLLCESDREAGLAELDPSGSARDYAPAWAERARCLRRGGRAAEALEAARRAVLLAPDEPNANLLIAELERERGKPERARAWLLAWLLRDPNAAAHWRAIDEQARELGDAALGRLALASRPSEAGVDFGADASADEPTPRELARRAVARGDTRAALEQTELLLSANPSDGNALVIALFAAACALDAERFEELLRAGNAAQLPDPEVAPLMVELIRFRVGDDAAERWSAAYRRSATAPH